MRRIVYINHVINTMPLAFFALLFLILQGCAHYGFADRPVDGKEPWDGVVSVSTLSGDAHLGLDLGTMTGHFVDMLRREGLSQTHWNNGSGDDVHLRCRVEGADVKGYGAHLSAASALSCEILARGALVDVVSASGMATGSGSEIDQAALFAAHSGLAEQALLDALGALATQATHRIRALPHHRPEVYHE